MRQKAVSLFLCYLLLYTCGCCEEEASSVPGPATWEKPLSFTEELQNVRMVVLPVRVVWSFWHRIRDLAPHWALSILLPDEKRYSEENSDSSFWGMVTYMAVGGGLMAAALPMLGFASTGIAANSLASSLMSWSAVANGGGVPAGGLVATLQSLGASGGSALMAKIGAFLGYTVHKQVESRQKESKEKK
ncbi:interferon alpha-inducible protein 6 isoform X1 [Bos taurus]|uniref:Interferon alpha inducible protein 6 n=1 Tax=Bos taurus TaxID=9913 RepID=A0AAF6YR44_BOVIN|nr:interferon alpha-inducible protein 6 isoform X1 [Bos taurus]